MKPLDRWVEEAFAVYGTAFMRVIVYLIVEVALLRVLSAFGVHVSDDSRLALTCLIIGLTFGVARGLHKCGVIPNWRPVSAKPRE